MAACPFATSLTRAMHHSYVPPACATFLSQFCTSARLEAGLLNHIQVRGSGSRLHWILLVALIAWKTALCLPEYKGAWLKLSCQPSQAAG